MSNLQEALKNYKESIGTAQFDFDCIMNELLTEFDTMRKSLDSSLEKYETDNTFAPLVLSALSVTTNLTRITKDLEQSMERVKI